jgi:hypothetical protein
MAATKADDRTFAARSAFGVRPGFDGYVCPRAPWKVEVVNRSEGLPQTPQCLVKRLYNLQTSCFGETTPDTPTPTPTDVAYRAVRARVDGSLAELMF